VKGTSNSLDFGARIYDPRIGRWLSTDPLFAKYPMISPYVGMANSPIYIKDVDGRDIIVISAPKGAGGFGHAAVLIGNDESGWVLYSKNGTYGSIDGLASSGPTNKHPEDGIGFNSLSDFANKNLDELGSAVEYKSAFRITSDKEVDAKMAKAASREIKENYDVVQNSCIDVASAALEAGGFDGGYNTYKLLNTEVKTGTSVPNTRYANIVKNNKGKDVTKSILPSEKQIAERKLQWKERVNTYHEVVKKDVNQKGDVAPKDDTKVKKSPKP
jgi:hypothetical protein